MSGARTAGGVTYRCVYEVVWCVKYRRPILVEEVEARLYEVIDQVCRERDSEIVSLSTMPDRVHLIVECDPHDAVHKLVKAMKARSSRFLRDNYPKVRSRVPSLWTNNYFIATVGEDTTRMIEQFVEAQRDI